MEQKSVGKITTTYKVRLYKKHLDWLENTKLLYNQVLEFYYKILIEHRNLLELNNYLLMRELEIMTIGTKEMKKEHREAEYTLKNFPKIPLYFRRAVINSAISLIRSYQKNLENWEQHGIGNIPSQAEQFRASPVFYKGMYRDFTKDSIQLKLYTGKEWRWVSYYYTGRQWSEGAAFLSPTIKVKKKEAWLHIPVVETVTDIRTIKERMETEREILAVSFPANDSMAVCVRMNLEGKKLDSYFIQGGKEWRAKKNRICKKIEKVKKSRGDNTKYQRENREESNKYYQEIKQLNDQMAHLVSRRIVDYSLKYGIRVIIVANYEKETEFKQLWYSKIGEYDWIGRKIIRFLKYKSFQNGIIVSSVRPYHILNICSECGRTIQKYSEGYKAGKKYHEEKLFTCPNGHRGNIAENAAKNIGKLFLKNF